jgi:hypothetical protein
MLTMDQTIEFMEQKIAQDLLSVDKQGLRIVQIAAGVMMAAAQSQGDHDTSQRFRFVAAHAANKLEELEGDNG